MPYKLSWNKDLSATMDADGWHSDTPSLQLLLQHNHACIADSTIEQRKAHAYNTAKALGAQVKEQGIRQATRSGVSVSI